MQTASHQAAQASWVECIGPESMRESSFEEASAPIVSAIVFTYAWHCIPGTCALAIGCFGLPHVQVAGLPIPQASVPRQLEILWERG